MKNGWIKSICSVLTVLMLLGTLYGVLSIQKMLPENPINTACPLDISDSSLDADGADYTGNRKTPDPMEAPSAEPPNTPEPVSTPQSTENSASNSPEQSTPSSSELSTEIPTIASTLDPSVSKSPLPIGNATAFPIGSQAPDNTSNPTGIPEDNTPYPSGEPGDTTPQPSGNPGADEPYIVTNLYSGIYTPENISNDTLEFYAYPAGGDGLILKVFIKERNEDTNNGNLLHPDSLNHFYPKLELNHEYIVTMYLYQNGILYGGASRFYITYRSRMADEDNPNIGEHPPTIVTNRDGDDSIITSSRFIFRVSARDWNGGVIYANHIKVMLDGVVQTNPTGSTVFEYSLYLSPPNIGDDIEHIVTVLAWDDEGNSAYRRIVLRYHHVPTGSANGELTITIDATTLGLGILIEEICTIHEGETAAEALIALLDDYGYEAEYGGTPRLNFYLRRIAGGDIAYYASIPDTLWQLILRDGITLTDQHDRDSIGEFDYTRGSGWMYCINGMYPGIGLSEYYPIDGDTLCLRFTLAFGKDIGGYDASGSGEGSLTSYCGLWINDEFIQLTHDYEEVERVDPTEATDGYIDYRCRKCHDEYREILPAIGNGSSGDMQCLPPGKKRRLIPKIHTE